MARGKTRRSGKPPKNTSCTGKKRYTKEEALTEVRRRFRETLGLYKAYRCTHGCRFEDGSRAWHIGHRSPK